MQSEQDPMFVIVDLFCGAGGTTSGFVQAQLNGADLCKVIACVNHDHNAIKSHWANHPEVKHYEEDIRTLDLTELTALVAEYRRKYPNAKLILWASLECTNFSNAKGGQPRDGDSRTLADHLPRYITALSPDYIQIENVVEFMSWGPLDEETGKPVSTKAGQDWVRWKMGIDELGYYNKWAQMNSANYGAYTSRNRLFGCFAKHDLPIVWPVDTHVKDPLKTKREGTFLKWMPVRDKLDFTDKGLSIFNRKKPMSDKSYERFYAGCIKFIAKGDTSFISKYYSGRPAGKVNSVDEPAGVITTAGNQSLVQVEGEAFLAGYYGNGDNVSGMDQPSPTLTTKDRLAFIQPEPFIDIHFGNSQNQSIDQPAGTIMTNDKHRLVSAESFILNPSHGGNSHSTDVPCPVIVARQDKAPLYFVQIEQGKVEIAVYDYDTPIVIKLKEFMVAFGIVDIKMRMLRVPELLAIQGFPDDYVLEGTQAEMKKYIGNSVHPMVPKVWAEAMAEALLVTYKLAA